MTSFVPTGHKNGAINMRKHIEKDLSPENVHRLITNSNTKKPYSAQKDDWSIPVYYVWRMIRYDLGEDPALPMVAQGMMIGHPQEEEAKAILHLIEEKYYPQLIGLDDIRRIV